MTTWAYILMGILVVFAVVAVISFLTSLIIVSSAARYSEKLSNFYTKRIAALLPGRDCRECGCGTCEECAGAVLYQDRDILCPYCEEEKKEKIRGMVQEYNAETENKDKLAPPRPFWRKESGNEPR